MGVPHYQIRKLIFLHLQYVEGHWHFAEHQPDFLPTFNEHHCDLFT